ncbi:carnitine 3-dehydrogenase [Hoeflea sp.]|uniref:carnitine 3-dehydrogenase n=1 Tax=Hoeflea sp. TaxID=1940281 RepID=UPI0019A7DA19|nr:carnitine 3-dehydrogenase [Hoeflea sp.]MBC7280102.1 carnitine 3-dehydrogenase [Hoeflea sp.]
MSEIKKAAIIGGGVIGGGWAARFLLNGWDVVVSDPDPEVERKVGEVLANARRSLPALSDVAVPKEGRLTYAASIAEAVADADWIQESAPERLDIKHVILAEIQKHCRTDALIGSSTSGFKPSELQQNAARPEQIFVAHPFNPVYLLPVIELVGVEATLHRAAEVLEAIGMKPLIVRKEIDAHIADRFLEAVWREALWLVKDGIATTQEIDDVIRYGFGMRWAQMGLFETYRIAGGEAGMRHFIAQFGPCLSWPWTKLMDVPELTQELTDMIADQSDAQSGKYSIRELERIRDDNLVSIMRALKPRNYGAGELLNLHDARNRPPLPTDISAPLTTLARVIPVDWMDYNGHMNESRYGQVFSDAGDVVMGMVGADQAYIDSGLSYFTVANEIGYLSETHLGDVIHVRTQVLEARGKKLRLYHEMIRSSDDELLATCNQLLVHVSLKTRKSCEPEGEVLAKITALGEAQAKLPRPASMRDQG